MLASRVMHVRIPAWPTNALPLITVETKNFGGLLVWWLLCALQCLCWPTKGGSSTHTVHCF